MITQFSERTRKVTRLRLIVEALGLAAIIGLVLFIVLNQSSPCEDCQDCGDCPDGKLLIMAFDQAWKQTWTNGTPPPDAVTPDVICWRVEGFDFAAPGEAGEYRAMRCVDKDDASRVNWSWEQ